MIVIEKKPTEVSKGSKQKFQVLKGSPVDISHYLAEIIYITTQVYTFPDLVEKSYRFQQ